MIRVSFADAGLFIATALLAAVALCAVLAAGNFSAHARVEATRAGSALTVRIVSPATPVGVARAAAVLRRTPGVFAAEPMSVARAARLLEQWGGATVDPNDLPPLHLIEVRRDADAAPRIESALRDAGVRAEFFGAGPADTRGAPISGLATPAGGIAFAAIWLTIALLFATAARVRGAAAAVAAEIGGLRSDSLALYGRAGCELAFLAGLAASIVCSVAAPGVLMAAGDSLSVRDMVSRISPMEAAVVLLVPLLTALAATLGARAGAARAFDRADRLQ